MAILENINLNRRSLRNILIVVIMAVIIFIAGYFVYDFFSKGSVTINTESGASIYELNKISGTYNKKFLGKTKISRRFSSGTYSFASENGDKSTIQTVEVKPMSSQTIEMKLIAQAKPAQVLKAQAINMQISKSEINYIDSSYNFLENFQFGKTESNLYPIVQASDNITSAQWVGNRKGLLSFSNSSYAFLDGTKLSFINPLPQSQNNNSDTEYDVNQIQINNKIEIISQLNSDLYYQKTLSASPEKLVGDLKSSSLNLDFSNNSLFAYSLVFDSVDPTSTMTAEKGDYNVYVKSAIDKKYDTKIPSDSNNLCLNFSPSSTKLLYCNSAGIFVYDLNTKKSTPTLTRMPQKPDVTIWVNDDNLIYFDNDALWLMNTKSQTLYKLVSGDNIRYTIATAVNDSKDKLFYTLRVPGATNFSSTVYSIDIKI